MRRHRLSGRRSRRMFSSGAMRVHRKNFMSQVSAPGPMRGGIRL